MSRNPRDEYQWQQTLERSAVLNDQPATEPGAEPGTTPRPGEIYLCRRTADFPVEWLVLDTHDEQLEVVAVDDYPLVGSHDVELPAPALGGVAVARTGVEARAGTTCFEPELRTHILPAQALERVRRQRAAVAEGTLEPTLLESVADGDLDYQRWIEGTLRPAVAALEAPARPAIPWHRRAARQVRRWAPALMAATFAALAVGLGAHLHQLGTMLEQAQERVAELERQGEDQAGQLATQSTRLDEETRQRQAMEQQASQLKGLLGKAETTVGTLRDQLSDTRRQLRQIADLETYTNLPRLFFGKNNRIGRGGQRGTPVVLGPGDDPRILFEIRIVDAEPYRTYRLRLEPTQGGEPLELDGLTRQGAELRFSLGRNALEPGDYAVRIDGVGLGEGPVPLEEWYRLTVEP